MMNALRVELLLAVAVVVSVLILVGVACSLNSELPDEKGWTDTGVGCIDDCLDQE